MNLLERLPFWVFFLIGILLIGLASLQFLTANGSLTRSDPFNAVPEFAPRELVFFGQFEEARHVAENGDVHILGQIDPFQATELDFGKSGVATVYGLFTAASKSGSREVPAIILARDNARFQAWMADNSAGNASMGDLFQIHGNVTYDRQFVAPIVNWLSEDGYRTPEEFIVLTPYTEAVGEVIPPSRLGRLLPVTLFLIGGFCLFLGIRKLELRRIYAAKDEGHGVAILEGMNT